MCLFELVGCWLIRMLAYQPSFLAILCYGRRWVMIVCSSTPYPHPYTDPHVPTCPPTTQSIRSIPPHPVPTDALPQLHARRDRRCYPSRRAGLLPRPAQAATVRHCGHLRSRHVRRRTGGRRWRWRLLCSATWLRWRCDARAGRRGRGGAGGRLGQPAAWQ